VLAALQRSGNRGLALCHGHWGRIGAANSDAGLRWPKAFHVSRKKAKVFSRAILRKPPPRLSDLKGQSDKNVSRETFWYD
jgi:hypothetical protein